MASALPAVPPAGAPFAPDDIRTWRVLVTGGAGMIGSTLVRRLVRDGAAVVSVVDNLWRGSLEYLRSADPGDAAPSPDPSSVIDLPTRFFERDLTKAGALDDILESLAINVVVHLADIVAGISYVFANQGFVFRQNLLINTNVIDSARRRAAQLRAFVNVGTACSWPKALQSSLSSRLVEEQLYPAEPESAYGWSKLMGCYEAELLGRECGVPVANIYFHNVYGPPCDYGPRSQVIPSLIRRAVLFPAEGAFTVWGSGAQGRAFLYVDDAVESLVLAVQRGLGKGDIQIGPDTCISIRELAETVVAISGKSIDIHFDLSKPEGDRGRCADFSKAARVLGWAPKVQLREGLALTYAWVEAAMARDAAAAAAATATAAAAPAAAATTASVSDSV